MPSPPRLTAADAETLLVSAGFKYLERRGHHRIYGRDRTRVVVPFDGRPELHPKAVRIIVESIERARPAASFGIDRMIVGTPQGLPPAMPGDLTLRDAAAALGPAQPPPGPPPALARDPEPAPVTPRAPEPAAHVEPRPAESSEGDGDIDLPRHPKPKGVWS